LLSPATLLPLVTFGIHPETAVGQVAGFQRGTKQKKPGIALAKPGFFELFPKKRLRKRKH
jgi:hypothetical protein